MNFGEYFIPASDMKLIQNTLYELKLILKDNNKKQTQTPYVTSEFFSVQV
jgi:hypothetical protein